jgi:aconitate hydratase
VTEVAGTLTAALVESHRAQGKRGGSRVGPSSRIALQPDHVVLEGEAGALALQLFATTGRERSACELTLVAGEDGSLRRVAASAELAALERAAILSGAVFSRVGNGPAHQVYAARFGAPGRLVVGTDRRIAAAGALGALALCANPIEAAAVLAGLPLELPWPEVAVVGLAGTPPAWVTGEDVMLELLRRSRLGPAGGHVLEFRLREPGALPHAARAAVAGRADELGALAALFPSDEATRAFFQSQGREPDWKPLGGDAEDSPPAALELDFSDLEPLILRDREVLRLRELNDAPVGTVWLGPEAPLADLERFRMIVQGPGMVAGLECVVTPGSRQVRETAARDGLLAALTRAGARIRSPGDAAPRPGTDGRLALACGVPAAAARQGWRLAGACTCAASAASGRVADPRAAPAAAGVAATDRALVVNDGLLLRPPPEGEARRERARSLASPPAIQGPLRGRVLLELGDHVGAARILPWGARARPLALRIDALAAFAFAGLEGGFASRARSEGGGFLVAGRGLGAGERREQAALVLVALGVRGVLARSFAAEFRRQLRQHGVLALRFGTDRDAETVGAGDELEIPDLPEGLEPGKPLVVRNLTRGSSCTTYHDLDEDGAREVRAGGTLAALRSARGA